MNYSEHKEGAQESYEELYQELGTLLRMTGGMKLKDFSGLLTTVARLTKILC